VLLVVDNAHGAYLRFLPGKLHPMELGADLCCGSAHKTLPVLTGGAYLHVSPQLPPMFLEQAKDALAMFGSTSPSYLILQSLDAANGVLSSEVYRAELAAVALRVANCVETLCGLGIPADGSIEPLKLTLRPKRYGYTGTELAVYLRANGIESEFADPDYLVLMFTPAITENDIRYLTTVLAALPRREAVTAVPPAQCRPRKILSIRDAAMAPRERLDVGDCLGRVLAAPSVGCPPAVPVLVCGEQIDDQALENFAYYGITQVTVVKKDT
jgi:arginine/lysine/ornithine decarboxylase